MAQRHSRTAKRNAARRRANRRRLPQSYRDACRLVDQGDYDEAHRRFEQLRQTANTNRLKALVENDLGVLAALREDCQAARTAFGAALEIDSACGIAQENLSILDKHQPHEQHTAHTRIDMPPGLKVSGVEEPCRVAILSMLFNWPSTAGGIIHTVELAKFLSRAGYAVQHFYARNDDWGVGRVEGNAPFIGQPIDFDRSSWNAAGIQKAFRHAVDQFHPDYVIITDSWNFKPLLAEAVRGYPYILRQQALECLCPLNNLRLLSDAEGQTIQCARHQLATPDICRRCVAEHGRASGGLHQAERALAGVGTAEYDQKLRQALAESEAVLVLNPLIAAMLGPYAKSVQVVTWGMDAARFPWPWPDGTDGPQSDARATIFMAGLVEEPIKGFPVLHEACAELWRKRQDFELVATGNPSGDRDGFTRFVGWLSQEELPRYLRAADMLVMPTIAQEGLGRTTVEAMAVGRPVIASRIGGLPYTVSDGATGLLFEPGNAQDLAAKIEILLDDPQLRQRMGAAGRRRFEEEFTWDVVIERHYRPLLEKRAAAAVKTETTGQGNR